MGTCTLKDFCLIFYSSLICNSQKQETSQCLSTGQLTNCCISFIQWICTIRLKEESQKHAKQKKPDKSTYSIILFICCFRIDKNKIL